MNEDNDNNSEIESASVLTGGPVGQEAEKHTIFDETRNTEILKHHEADYPPCLRDISLKPVHTSNAFQRVLQVLNNELLQRVGQRPACFRVDLQLALYRRQLLPGLPDRTNESKHVYVVTKPHVPFEVSWLHWSVYSQGYFYHLSADSPNGLTGQSGCSGARRKTAGTQTLLKIEDFSTVDSAHYAKAMDDASKQSFVAYEMGSTQYDPEQLETLARWIIARLGTYELLAANCQFFAISLIHRAVMTRRDCSAFVGNKTQRVDWDLRARHKDDIEEVARVPYDFEHGYLVRKPRIRHSRSFRTMLPFFVLFPISGTKLKAINTLYEHGPSIGTSYRPKMDPAGKHGILTYPFVSVQARTTFRYHSQYLRLAVREFGEDLLARRWRDALYGRKETRDRFKVLLSKY